MKNKPSMWVQPEFVLDHDESVAKRFWIGFFWGMAAGVAFLAALELIIRL